jgi:hypothetical protein
MNDLLCAKCAKLIEGHAVQGPGGWLHPSCAEGPRTKPVLIFAIVGCAVLFGFALLLLVFLAIWQFLSPERPPSDGGASTALTERYESGNGMLTAHYPASFAASKQGDTAVVVTRALPDGNAEMLVLEAVAQPISSDIEEIDRLVSASEAKQLDRYVVLSKRAGTCNGWPGLEVSGSFFASNGAAYDRRVCRFYDGGHVYSFAFALPHGKPMADARLLETIVEATELRR